METSRSPGKATPATGNQAGAVHLRQRGRQSRLRLPVARADHDATRLPATPARSWGAGDGVAALETPHLRKRVHDPPGATPPTPTSRTAQGGRGLPAPAPPEREQHEASGATVPCRTRREPSPLLPQPLQRQATPLGPGSVIRRRFGATRLHDGVPNVSERSLRLTTPRGTSSPCRRRSRRRGFRRGPSRSSG
jgi:hypothetical protein